MFTLGEVLSIIVSLASGIGAYVAIKVDLASVKEKAEQAVKSAHNAHQRIDGILSK